MSRKRHKIQEQEVQGLKYFKALSGMLEALHAVGCQRDRAGNRLLHMDQYVGLPRLHASERPAGANDDSSLAYVQMAAHDTLGRGG